MSSKELTLVPFAEPRGIARRKCSKCGKPKTLSEFGRHPKGYLWLRSQCTSCRVSNGRDYRGRNREWHRDYKRRYNREHADDRRAYRARTRPLARVHEAARRTAKRSTDPFSPSDLWASWEDRGIFACFWCERDVSSGYHIDHVYPLSRGGRHVVPNLVPACVDCNLAKWAHDPWEFLRELRPELFD